MSSGLRLFELLEGFPRVSRAQIVLDRIALALVVIGYGMGAMLSLTHLKPETFQRYEWGVSALSIAILAEYLLRVYASGFDPDDTHTATVERLRFAFWSLHVLDPIAVGLMWYGVNTNQPEFLTGGFTLRLFRIFRFTTADDVVWEALSRSKKYLMAVMQLWAVFILGGAGIMYAFEHHAQPDKFTDLFSSLYYTFTTFTSTGYGDLYPITPVGRAVGLLIMGISAICLLGMPIGIIATEFMEIQRERHKDEDTR